MKFKRHLCLLKASLISNTFLFRPGPQKVGRKSILPTQALLVTDFRSLQGQPHFFSTTTFAETCCVHPKILLGQGKHQQSQFVAVVLGTLWFWMARNGFQLLGFGFQLGLSSTDPAEVRFQEANADGTSAKAQRKCCHATWCPVNVTQMKGSSDWSGFINPSHVGLNINTEYTTVIGEKEMCVCVSFQGPCSWIHNLIGWQIEPQQHFRMKDWIKATAGCNSLSLLLTGCLEGTFEFFGRSLMAKTSCIKHPPLWAGVDSVVANHVKSQFMIQMLQSCCSHVTLMLHSCYIFVTFLLHHSKSFWYLTRQASPRHLPPSPRSTRASCQREAAWMKVDANHDGLPSKQRLGHFWGWFGSGFWLKHGFSEFIPFLLDFAAFTWEALVVLVSHPRRYPQGMRPPEIAGITSLGVQKVYHWKFGAQSVGWCLFFFCIFLIQKIWWFPHVDYCRLLWTWKVLREKKTFGMAQSKAPTWFWVPCF